MAAKGYLRALGEEMRRRREAAGLSQEQLALNSEVSLTLVGRLERGRYNPSILKLKSLLAELDVKASDLFSSIKD